MAIERLQRDVKHKYDLMIGPLKKDKLDKKLFDAEKTMLRNKILKLESELTQLTKDNEDLATYLHKGLQVHM